MKSIIKTVIIALCTLSLMSCEELFLEKPIKSTPQSNFEFLWKQVNEKYAFLDYKDVKWDELKKEYATKIKDDMSDEELFDVLGDMLKTLRDGHVSLTSAFNKSYYNIALTAEKKIDSRVLLKHYLKEDFYSSANFMHNFIADKKIGYIRYPSFQTGIISEQELDYILTRYKDTEGLIIDIRENGGGSMPNVERILKRFTFKKTLVYSAEAKSGPGANDFTKIKEVYVDAENSSNVKKEKKEMVKYNKNVAVLTDRGSYSASSFFALCTKAYPKIFLVGDNTGGGLGLPHGGQLPNGWIYQFSITRTLDINGENHENGVPVDIPATLTQEQVAQGKDNVIEKAVEELLKRAKI